MFQLTFHGHPHASRVQRQERGCAWCRVQKQRMPGCCCSWTCSAACATGRLASRCKPCLQLVHPSNMIEMCTCRYLECVQVAAARTKTDVLGQLCDLAFYKDGQLAVLSRGESKACEAKLLLLPTEGLAMSAHDPVVLQATSSILQARSASTLQVHCALAMPYVCELCCAPVSVL